MDCMMESDRQQSTFPNVFIVFDFWWISIKFWKIFLKFCNLEILNLGIFETDWSPTNLWNKLNTKDICNKINQYELLKHYI